MLRELTNLELSEISGGGIHCAVCNKEFDGGEDIASIIPVYNIYTMKRDNKMEKLPDTFFYGESALICYKSKCVRKFISSQAPFKIGNFYYFINPTITTSTVIEAVED